MIPYGTNGTSGPRVLLLGQRTNWGWSLIAMLEKSHCTVHFAQDLDGTAADAADPKSFDLILAGSECRHEAHLLPGLAGSRASVFYVFPVENSCWWVPALLGGVECYGSSALRPAEFAAELRELLGRHSRQRMQAAS